MGSGLTTLLTLGNGAIGIWGWWVGAFGVSAGLRSKKTVCGLSSFLCQDVAHHVMFAIFQGADKRTSAFPFKNKTAASEQKKVWKKEHQQ